MPWDATLWAEKFIRNFSQEILPWLPKPGAAFLLLVVGWIGALSRVPVVEMVRDRR